MQLIAPLIGLYNVRGGHSNASLHQARALYCPKKGNPRFFHFFLPTVDDKNVPLNWILSEDVADGIWGALLKDSGNAKEFDRLKASLVQ